MAKRNPPPEDKATETTGTEERASRSTMFTFRLPREELALIEQAATEAGMSVAEYVRKSVAMRPTVSVLARPQYDVLVSTPFFQYGMVATWSEARIVQNESHSTMSGPALFV